MFMNPISRQMYIANVIAPLCSEYLDMVHAEAAYLRKKLLARPPTSSSSSTTVPSVSVLRSANLPSNELLTSNTNEWAALITGTHLAAQAVLLHSSNNLQRQQHQITEEQPPPGVLDRVGESMERLCTAMVEEYTSALVETIVMERAKLASYMMRAPFLLSEPPPDSPGRRDKGDHDMSIGSRVLSLSPDLNDSIHVVSVCIKACNSTMSKIKSMFQSDDNEGGSINNEGLKGVASIEPSTFLYHGCYSIHEALKFAIGQKLLDIAIDPQGMTPEIYLGGALQFKHDVMTFDRIFHLGSNGGSEERRGRTDINNNTAAGPMERVITASHLMSLESSQIQAMRDTFRSLVTPNASIGSLFGRTADDSTGEFNAGSRNRLDVDDFYKDQRLMEEAIRMLEAKGFGALALDEALSILNRRC